MPVAAIALPLLAFAVALGGAVLGLWLTDLRRRTSVMLPFSAGVLLGVALFGLIPELAMDAGWAATLLLFTAGYGALLAVNRYGWPVCAVCAHDHDHSACAERLHGFAGPLVLAAALHSFLDGWSIASVQQAGPASLRLTVLLAIALHKFPEGIALGGVLRAAVPSRALALAWCALAESATLAGAWLGLLLEPRLGAQWTMYPLGLTAGWLAYLGYHAVHEEWKRSGAGAAFVSALTGVAGAAALQRGAAALFR